MTKYLVLFLLVNTSCGDVVGVQTGRFEVEKTFKRWTQTGGTLCAETATQQWEANEVVWATWIISEVDDGYTLTEEDALGNQMITGSSSGGYYFELSGPVMGGHISIKRRLKYKKNRFTGTEVNTWSIAGNHCSENWDLVGHKE